MIRSLEAEYFTPEYFTTVRRQLATHCLSDLSLLIVSFLKPLYFLHSSTIKPAGNLSANIAHKRIVQTFLKAGNQTDAFHRILSQILTSQEVLYEIRNVKYPYIATPSSTALEMHTAHYRRKYGIEMHICTLGALAPFLTQRDPKKPLGVIVVDSEIFNEEGHVVSVLCAQEEFLVIDSSKENRFAQEVMKALMPLKGAKCLAYLQSQADNHSCRTGALLMLRNILLFYKGEEGAFGIVCVLKGFKIELKQREGYSCVDRLPPAWMYTEQIVPPDHLKVHHLVPRDRFSQKPPKRLRHKYTFAFRQAHQKESMPHELAVTLDRAQILQLQQHKAPLNVQFPSETTLVVNISFAPNTYLLHKAFRNREKLRASEGAAK